MRLSIHINVNVKIYGGLYRAVYKPLRKYLIMIVDKKGKYRLLKDWENRGTISVGTLPAGTIINVIQIDKQYKRVIADEMYDWNHWDLPVERVYIP